MGLFLFCSEAVLESFRREVSIYFNRHHPLVFSFPARSLTHACSVISHPGLISAMQEYLEYQTRSELCLKGL